MKPLTHEWSQKAEGDYTVVATLWQAESVVYDAICFHAQQCIEKYLKAWLGPRRLHRHTYRRNCHRHFLGRHWRWEEPPHPRPPDTLARPATRAAHIIAARPRR